MFSCEIHEQPAKPTLTIRFRTPVEALPAELGRVYGAVGQHLDELGEMPAAEGVFALYHNMDMQNLDIEAGFSVAKPLPGKDDIQANEVPSGTYAVCHYTGPYEDMAPAYEALTQFIQDQGYAPSGIAYEWYLNGPDEVAPQDLKTDIVFPVTRVTDKATA